MEETFPDEPRMLKVLQCESGLTHYTDSGSVLMGKTTPDIGVAQINLPAHGKRMERLGLDPQKIRDNIEYARILYDEQGLKPWVCARKLALI